MIKGLLVLLAVFCVLMGLLIWAKSRPGPGADLLRDFHPAVMVVSLEGV
ncbi:hypothetical protein C8N43_1708 [Litoreibacter ponti]|uniref:Uncharacterized protein n=1 Tax=Litoreibacter ponti TaxID=1510457 RepID=A0A2T6BLT4_9RHOB|nr:hypothetical protein [Litoreibacter ponti]PTX57043.1 hypothetical protein C8N43_1708 [Litoreibacter ponti]